MKTLSRRDALKLIAVAGVAVTGCTNQAGEQRVSNKQNKTQSSIDPILSVRPLPSMGPWPTIDPFLFCVHHVDDYPAGNGKLGPVASLTGRDLGQDFAGQDGWSMYHGQAVPGFPRHPHRGFETITVVRNGIIDHADSLGAAARYGDGDVQWLTAGDGINHAEMFPLLRTQEPNPTDFFQIWLNLPAANKRVAPHFSMFWANQIPIIKSKDAMGHWVEVTIVAGRYQGSEALSPPPNSWASSPESDLAIWTVRLASGAQWTLPAAQPGTQRSLYTVRGAEVEIAGRAIAARHHLEVMGDQEVGVVNGSSPSELLLLQGRPIGEPIAHYGPFVMNTQEEIAQAITDYRATEFGGWPWKSTDPTHGNDYIRFARHADGREEKPI